MRSEDIFALALRNTRIALRILEAHGPECVAHKGGSEWRVSFAEDDGEVICACGKVVE